MRRSALALLLLVACDQARAPYLMGEGDPCHTEFAGCLDDDRIQRCVDRKWERTSCSELCGVKWEFAVGAWCQRNIFGSADCYCEYAAPFACTPGEFRCQDDQTLLACNGQQRWETHPCEAVCRDIGPSLGCRPAVSLADAPPEGIPPEEQYDAACHCGQ
ncbi:MAG: hypothetical protein AAF799_18615 [Myxococcota bacterium]